MAIELDMLRVERDFGIGCNIDKVVKAIMEQEEPEITFKPVEIFIDETTEPMEA